MPGFIAGVAKFVGTILTGTTAGAVAARLGVSVLLSVVSSKLFGPKVPRGVGVTSHQVTARGALEYRKVVYGQALVSGPIVYQNTTGTDLEDLWTVVALCQDESESIEEIWLDGERILVADIDWTPGEPGSGTGAVSTARWVGENSVTALNIFWRLGTADQTALSPLTGEYADLNTNFRLRGITYLVFKMINTVDTEKVWADGVPQNFKALVKGRKVYDPRLDSTNGGTGSHRVDDESTWEWSDNPVLCANDYMRKYMGVS